MNFNNLCYFIVEQFLLSFFSGVDFLFRSVSVSISIIWQAGLFFRSYSGNLPAMLNINNLNTLSRVLKSVVE